jgi:hypothetical protein
MVTVVALSVGLACLKLASETTAGVALALTLAFLAVAVLAAVYRREAARASWFGFALFGWGYMVMTSEAWWGRPSRPAFVTSEALDLIFPLLRPDQNWVESPRVFSRLLSDPHPHSQLILTKLDEPISMRFANGMPLEDVLKYIKAATQGPRYDGIPIYVDPIALERSGKTMTSPVTIDVEGVPLRRTLAIVLNQLGLRYEVRDGLLVILSGSRTALAFLRIGHCYFALLAGFAGALASRYLHATRNSGHET